MLRFIVSRLVQTVLTLLAIVTITFFMVFAAPGDPFSAEKAPSIAVRANLEAAYGLDKPLHIQYLTYLKNLLKGDLGPTYTTPGKTVTQIISESFPTSLGLGLRGLAIALFLGIPAGIIAAVKKNSPADYIPMSLAMAGICLPSFVLGPILALFFGLYLGWFSVSGWSYPTDWILPAFTLGLFYAAYIARITRGGMLEILNQDFIRTAKAKGVPPMRVIRRHALRGALLPVVAFLGPTVAGLLSGSFVVEKIFRIPGLGTHFINAAVNRDYTLVLGTVIFFATLILIFNLLADIIQVWMNPRQRITD